MYHIFKLMDIRNRAYVVDNQGNKIFYGTMYQCGKFIEYMKGGEADGTETGKAGIRQNGVQVVES
mgnify:CR=1 FL=1